MKERKKDAKEKKEGNDFFFLFHESKHEAEDRIMRSPAWTGDLKIGLEQIIWFLKNPVSQNQLHIVRKHFYFLFTQKLF